MQNYDGQFKLNGQEYFYRAKDDSGSSKITRVNNEEHHYRMVENTPSFFILIFKEVVSKSIHKYRDVP